MTGVGVKVVGLKEAQTYLRKLEQAAESADTTVRVGSSLNYAYGIETGRHKKTGRVARAAGGAFYLSRALALIEKDLPKRLAAGLKEGEPAETTLLRAGYDVEAEAKKLVPHVTRTLQRSIRTVPPGGGRVG